MTKDEDEVEESEKRSRDDEDGGDDGDDDVPKKKQKVDHDTTVEAKTDVATDEKTAESTVTKPEASSHTNPGDESREKPSSADGESTDALPDVAGGSNANNDSKETEIVSSNKIQSPATKQDETSHVVTAEATATASSRVVTVGPEPSSIQPAAMPSGLPPLSASNAFIDVVEEKGTVSALYVGRVIGKGGEMIRDLQARSSCRIDVDQNVPQGQPRVITYRGTRRQVDFAKHLVALLSQDNVSDADLPLGDAKQEFLSVPAHSVGKIIGRSGEMIRELQSKSHAKIQVDHQRHPGTEQKHVTITGTENAVAKAKEMILFLVANPLMDAMQAISMLIEDKMHRGGVWGSGPPYPNMPNMGQNMQPDASGNGGYGYGQNQSYYGGQHGMNHVQPYAAAPPAVYTAPAQGLYQQHMPQNPYVGGVGGGVEIEVFYAAKQFMGRIIGQKGVTINDIQRRSSTDLQINQDVPPGQECEITIRGSRPGIETAKQMLREIIEIGPHHPYAGGGPPTAVGGYQQAGFGGHKYGYQNQDQGGYGPGYQQMFGHQSLGYDQGYSSNTAPVPGYGQPSVPYHQTTYSPPPIATPPQQMSEWKSATSHDGQVYYYNERTGQTQWEKPPGMP